MVRLIGDLKDFGALEIFGIHVAHIWGISDLGWNKKSTESEKKSKPLTLNGTGRFTYQHLPRGANKTLRDGSLVPFRNHLAPKLEGLGILCYLL